MLWRRYSTITYYATARCVACCRAATAARRKPSQHLDTQDPTMKKNNHVTTLSALCLCAGLSLFSVAAHAMGDDSEKTPDCPKGQVYDSKTKSCMVEKGSKISDQDKTQYAYHLAKTGRFQDALDLLNTLQQPNTREAWNYRGYATRKLGRT